MEIYLVQHGEATSEAEDPEHLTARTETVLKASANGVEEPADVAARSLNDWAARPLPPTARWAGRWSETFSHSATPATARIEAKAGRAAAKR